MPSDLDGLLDDLHTRVQSELRQRPDVVERRHALDLATLPIQARQWHRLAEGFAVVIDLKSSTHLGRGRKTASAASIYEAATGNAVRIFDRLDVDFLAIQGDGVVGIFWGPRAWRRAIAAGLTVLTFSRSVLVPALERKWPNLPKTGFKVGLAASPLLVKRVGLRRTGHQEPIWAGQAVNYAAKCAQQADRHQLVVTRSLWQQIRANEHLASGCGCAHGHAVWREVDIERLAPDDPERPGRRLVRPWCRRHVAGTCTAILDGQQKRPRERRRATR